MNYCKYTDVFYGNGEVDHYYSDGLASKWFYIKALCGNTTPHAVLPFGKISVGAYSGGYPTGYGTHFPNSCGGIKKISDTMCIRGISHLHHSGTGAIGYYYNYAVTTPFYGDLSNITKFYPGCNEQAQPGYYGVTFNGIDCEVTVSANTAYHHYYFENDGGRVAVDFSNDGLLKDFGKQFYGTVGQPYLEVTPFGEVLFSGILSGVKLYFCAAIEGVDAKAALFAEADVSHQTKLADIDASKPFGGVFDFDGKSVIVKISYSTIDFEHAKANVRNSSDSFDTVMNKAYSVWNKYLSRVEITTDNEELKGKFYSNLYHSLIKPADMTGESILGVEGAVVSDLATLWDQYKTLYPLIFMLYPDMGQKLAAAIENISKTNGRINCSFGLSNIYPCEEQAKMLGIMALCDGYHFGTAGVTSEMIDNCTKRELERSDFKCFVKKGVFERYTHILDTTDACLDVAKITADEQLKKQLLDLAANWKNAYGSDGLMSDKSPYYEGDRYTYSFRLQSNMQERVELAGGKEKFAQMLDEFFGIYGASVQQITKPDAYEEISSMQYHRFEGFNNECDMEAPYAYIYAGRHDRTCDIVNECVHRSFTTGKGGLPGNNDSGGLSSCFVWNVLGLFPVSGSGEILLGAPRVNRAVLHLAGGNDLEIEAKNLSRYDCHVASVTFNN
ncbi:MAG: glycoside hydrolase family 92 protein, partial [Clostridia bacterium]|nr:glycoside hydrolase family 92 protein [Clostridia bacterium]